jgi:hypothetical protein
MKSVSHLIAIILCGLLMAAFSSAHAASFGRTTVGATPSAGLRADFKRGSKFVLTENGTFQEICIYVDMKGGGTGKQALRFALYRDRNGLPAELLLETANIDFPANPQVAAAWYCFWAAAVPLEPGAYWVMMHSGGDPSIVRYYHDGPANWYGNVDLFDDGSADLFGSGISGEGTISIHVNYTPDSQLRFAGRRTIASRASSPMSSSFKRGSSFMISEQGTLNGFSAYVDGLGGASGAQTLTLALYDDVNNEPSALLAQQTVRFQSPIAGRSGRWVTAQVTKELVPLVPGRYWLVLHTSGPAGVMRYYLDGAANWRGNANAGSSASDIFGAANPGDGTVSAFITYRPANVVQYDFGQPTPGTIPSKGLSANFIRGSSTRTLYAIGEPNYMTALWAYLDGKGGATGSQTVRLAVYDQALSPMVLVMQSAEVTIPAGTPMGWVRFAVPYTQVFWSRSYAIMIMTSGTAGVVRNYVTNEPGLWLGAPTPYVNGPPSVLYQGANAPGQPVLQTGNGRVSVFANYQAVWTP